MGWAVITIGLVENGLTLRVASMLVAVPSTLVAVTTYLPELVTAAEAIA